PSTPAAEARRREHREGPSPTVRREGPLSALAAAARATAAQWWTTVLVPMLAQSYSHFASETGMLMQPCEPEYPKEERHGAPWKPYPRWKYCTQGTSSV